MKALPVLAILMATGLPLAACAQQSADAAAGPSPAIVQARAAAKTAAFNDLGETDRAKVQAVIDQVNGGQLTDMRAAAQQIDAILTPSESTAVLAERTKMMQTIRANMPARPDGAGPSAATHKSTSSVGRFLLQLGVSPEKLRELRHAQQKPQ